MPKIGSVGTPVPVVDDPRTNDQTFASQTDIGGLVDPYGSGGVSGNVVSSGSTFDEKPPDTFVVVEKLPEIVKAAKPVYPPLALKAGLEGKVIVRIWVDRQGQNRQVEILKSNYEIFNEAALEAARQYIFTPAYMNSGPVSVWVAVPFTFKLSSR